MTNKKSDEVVKAKKPLPKKLRDDVAEKYTLKTIRPGKYNFHKFGTIDLRTINLKKADELVENGFRFLVAKPLKKTDKPTE